MHVIQKKWHSTNKYRRVSLDFFNKTNFSQPWPHLVFLFFPPVYKLLPVEFTLLLSLISFFTFLYQESRVVVKWIMATALSSYVANAHPYVHPITSLPGWTLIYITTIVLTSHISQQLQYIKNTKQQRRKTYVQYSQNPSWE